MAERVIEVCEDLNDPDAPIFEEIIRTEIVGRGWFWTHVASPRGEVSREPHGPFSDEEKALADASRTLKGSLL